MSTDQVADEQPSRYAQLLADAIVGVGFPAIYLAHEAQKLSLATFTGNQHNEAWAWDHSRLATMTETELLDLYVRLKAAQ